MEHRMSRDPNHPRDFLDVYLAEIEKKENPNFDQEALELTCLDLFKVFILCCNWSFIDLIFTIYFVYLKAGAETTSTTLLW